MYRRKLPWAEMRRKYEAGGYTYRKLAEEYGVSAQSVAVHARNELWGGRSRRETARRETGRKCLTQVAEVLMTATREAARQVEDGDAGIKELKELAGVLQTLAGLEKTLNGAAAPAAETVQVVLGEEVEELSR